MILVPLLLLAPFIWTAVVGLYEFVVWVIEGCPPPPG